jgi:DNA-binding NarL/FixJ family response regulator
MILTIHAGEEEKQRAFRAGADGFIVKGTPLETLVKAIRSTLVPGEVGKGERE